MNQSSVASITTSLTNQRGAEINTIKVGHSASREPLVMGLICRKKGATSRLLKQKGANLYEVKKNTLEPMF